MKRDRVYLLEDEDGVRVLLSVEEVEPSDANRAPSFAEISAIRSVAFLSTMALAVA